MNSEFWRDLSLITPSAVALKVYWIATIPIVALALIAAACALLIRTPDGALFAFGAFLIAILLNVGELAVITAVHRSFASTIAAGMDLAPGEVGGLQVGIVLSLASLAYKAVCQLYLHQARQVRELFGPVTWRRLRLWAATVFVGEDPADEAAA